MDEQAKKILICCEDRKIVMSLQGALRSEDYIFQYVVDIENAIQQLNPGDYHALLLGVSRESKEGKLDSLRAIPIIRKIDSRMPIIAIAQDESLETERKARLAGIFYYLPQPLEINEVRMSIMNAVQKYNKY